MQTLRDVKCGRLQDYLERNIRIHANMYDMHICTYTTHTFSHSSEFHTRKYNGNASTYTNSLGDSNRIETQLNLQLA